MGQDPDPDVAQLIEVTNFCETFSCLPKAGGLFDQDLYYIVGIGKVKLAMAEKQKKDSDEEQARAKATAKHR